MVLNRRRGHEETVAAPSEGEYQRIIESIATGRPCPTPAADGGTDVTARDGTAGDGTADDKPPEAIGEKNRLPHQTPW
ncbi:hypothetical protein ACFY78_01590 [Streptomyces olindensis]|uniref:hypothetical protein n=1 Tax=Streptomyces olindensis TaxID=358823 RepID=UPI003679F8F1